MVAYLDPTSAFVGYAGAVAINQSFGGDMNNFTPAINYFKELKQNRPIVPKQTAYARVISGEIPILLDYDFNAYRAKYKDNANISFVIPKEGSVVVPYVMSSVKNSPNPENGHKVLDFVLSDKGQRVWAEAFLRPIIASAMTPEIEAKFLPAADYARAVAVDFAAMAEAQNGFSERYLNEVR
jgi:putative spermidine/putrescine transport system substrate-binding protein